MKNKHHLATKGSCPLKVAYTSQELWSTEVVFPN